MSLQANQYTSAPPVTIPEEPSPDLLAVAESVSPVALQAWADQYPAKVGGSSPPLHLLYQFARSMVLSGVSPIEALRIVKPPRKGADADALSRASMANHWAKHPVTRAFASELRAMVARESVVMTERQVLERLSSIASASVAQVVDADGFLLPVSEWPAGFAQAVASLEFDPSGRVKRLKMWSKVQALDLLAKHHGLLERDNLQRRASPFDGLPRDAIAQIRDALASRLASRPAVIDAEVVSESPTPGAIHDGGDDA